LNENTAEDRYARHRLIDWWDQERLRSARVMVAGAGAIGNEVIKNLALLGVGHVLIVDSDTVELSNLTRSVLFRAADRGRPKAEVAAERAAEIDPESAVRALVGDIEFDVGLGVYRDMDVVIGCLDSVQARLTLNRLCRRAGVPWLNGGIEATVAEVSLFGARSGACYECAMSAEMWEARNRRFACGGLRAEDVEEKMPTTAVVASLVAAYLVNEALLLLHAEDAAHKEGLECAQKLYLTLKPYHFGVYDLPENSACLAHETWEPIEGIEQSKELATPRILLDFAGEPNGSVELGFDLLTAMRCMECGALETVLQPLERCGMEWTLCPHCRTRSRQPEAVNWLDATGPYADVPLALMGVPEGAVLGIQGAGARRFLQLQGADRFGGTGVLKKRQKRETPSPGEIRGKAEL
jgi:molybdopterin/thiamine biosynthesis adenylyltransferase